MQTRIASLDEIELLEAPDVTLYSTAGRVLSAREFARHHLGTLAPHERSLVADHLDALPAPRPLPLARPVVRTAALADGGEELPARRSGARSALMPERGLKLKGCRPEPAEFPEWTLDDDFRLQVRRIPFGVLTAEGVARELLAHSFLVAHGLPRATTPVAVLEYGEGGAVGFALVSELASDERLESLLDCGGITLHRLLRLARAGDRLGLLGREVALSGIELGDYVARKAEMLVELNFHGGFRGVLNSNIGNDMIADGELVALCDFDDFFIRPRPQPGDERNLRRFVLQAFLELLKSSLPIVDYLPLDGASASEAHRALAACYRAESSLYRAYRDRFLERAGSLGWNLERVAGMIDEAFALEVAFELLQELVPNSLTLSRFTLKSVYVPHG